MRVAALLTCALVACAPPAPSAPAQQGITRAFVIAEPALVPEGIAYDPQTGATYVSSTWQRRIVRVDSSGAVRDFTPRDSDALYGVVGMQVDVGRRRLWAAHSSAGAGMPIERDESSGRSGLALFDLDTGQMLRNLTPPGEEGHFLNDLAIAADGGIYVTDSMSGAIYRAGPDGAALEHFVTLPDQSGGNGIALTRDERFLYVADMRGGAFRVEIATRNIVRMTMPEGIEIGADGLYLHEGDLIAVQPWQDACRVCRFKLDETGTHISAQRALATTEPDFLQPTTGVIVDDAILVIANAQLQHFRALWEQHRGEPPREMLHDIVIVRVPLGD